MSSKLKQKAAKAAAAATSGRGTYTKQQLLELSVASEEKIRSLLQVSHEFHVHTNKPDALTTLYIGCSQSLTSSTL
jgi:predicted kinase